MPLLDIVSYPDARLKTDCEEVTSVDDSIRTLLDDMTETMYEAPGVGLAAPQVGVLKRVIVVDPGPDRETEEEENSTTPSGSESETLLQLVNPVIINAEGLVDSEEGCLSIPGIRETIKRDETIIVEALDRDGNQVKIEADGFLAIVLQHEIDHLNGVLFIDHLSRLKQKLVKSKIKKLSKGS